MDWKDTSSLAHTLLKVRLFTCLCRRKHVNHGTPIDQILNDRTSILDPLCPQRDSSQEITKQSPSPPGDIGSNVQQQHATIRENGDKARQRHKSLLITNCPSSLVKDRSNKASSESDGFRPPNSNEKSHDMHLEINPLLQEVALTLSQLASICRTGKIPEVEVELLPTKVI